MNTSRTDAVDQNLDEPLISITELAHWLSVSPHTVKKWCNRGPEAKGPDGKPLVPLMRRINGQIRFRPADVRAWIDSKVVEAA